jgi:hypothetical protein
MNAAEHRSEAARSSRWSCVTQVYRREGDEWKLVHRHGGPGPGGNPAVDHLRAEMRNRTGDDLPT